MKVEFDDGTTVETRGIYEYNGLNWRTIKQVDTTTPFDGVLDQERRMYYSPGWHAKLIVARLVAEFGQPGEHVSQVRSRLDLVQPGASDQAEPRRRALAAEAASGKEPVFALMPSSA